MNFRSNPWYLSLLLLLLFLGARSMDYHPASHSNEDAPYGCQLCEFVLLVQDAPFTPAEEPILSGPHTEYGVDLPQFELPVRPEQENFSQLFYRPPPSPFPAQISL